MARKRVTRGSVKALASIYLTEDMVDVAGVFSRGNGLTGEAIFGLLDPVIGPFVLRFYQSVNGAPFSLVLTANPASSNDIVGSPCGPVLATGQLVLSYSELCMPNGELLLRTQITSYTV